MDLCQGAGGRRTYYSCRKGVLALNPRSKFQTFFFQKTADFYLADDVLMCTFLYGELKLRSNLA